MEDVDHALDVGEVIKATKKEKAAEAAAKKPLKKPVSLPEPEKRWMAAVLLAVLVVAYLGFRLSTDSFPALEAQAEKVAETYYTSKISQEVKSTYVTLSDYEQQQIIKKQLSQKLQEESVQQEIKDLQDKYIAAYKDVNDVPYLYTADGYYYLRRTRNLIETGSECQDGEFALRHTNCERSLYATVSYHFYRFLHLFSKTSVEQAVRILPVLLGLLSLILLFFIGNRFGSYVGFFAGIAFIFSSEIFKITRFGFSDTNPLNVLFTLCIVFVYLQLLAICQTPQPQKKWQVYAWLFSLIVLGLAFRFSWTGYFYIFGLIILHLFALAGWKVVMLYRTGSLKKVFLIVAGAVVVVLLLSVLLLQTDYVARTKARLFKTETVDMLPRAFSSINELQSLSITAFVAMNGGLITHLFLLFGIVFLCRFVWRHLSSPGSFAAPSFLLLWLGLLLPAAYLSLRFYSFYVLPFALIFGYGLHVLLKSFVPHLSRHWLASFAVACVFAIFSALALFPSVQISKLPLADDAVQSAGEKIFSVSTPLAVVNTWWDEGYFYEYFSRRETVMDGGYFPGDKMYALALVLTATNETQAVNLLKVLDCNALPQDIASILMKSSSLAGTCSPEMYVVVSDGYMYKYAVFKNYAERDLQKAALYGKLVSLSFEDGVKLVMETYGVDRTAGVRMYYDIKARNPDDIVKPSKPYFSDLAYCSKRDDFAVCEGGLAVNLTSGKTYSANKGAFPYMYVSEDGVEEHLDTKADYTLILRPLSTTKLAAYFIRSDLLDELYVRLFFLDGYGLSHFEKVHEFEGDVVQHVKVYKVVA